MRTGTASSEALPGAGGESQSLLRPRCLGRVAGAPAVCCPPWFGQRPGGVQDGALEPCARLGAVLGEQDINEGGTLLC